MSTLISPSIKAVVLDIFGTALRIQNPVRPYRQLQALMAAHGRSALQDDAIRMMTVNVGMIGFAIQEGLPAIHQELIRIEKDLFDELARIQPFEDVAPVLAELKHRGLAVGVCSNLAKPYGVPVRLHFPGLDAYSLSYEVGYTKPDERIYEHALHHLRVRPEEVLFIGDTPVADFYGPREFGMSSCLLDRLGKYPDIQPSIRSLHELVA